MILIGSQSFVLSVRIPTRIYKKLDLWSITDGLDRMMDYCYNGNEKSSPYWGYYYDF